MEQKHLDEQEDSYFGEEFIDEESLTSEIKVEKATTPKAEKETKAKASSKKAEKKETVSKTEEKKEKVQEVEEPKKTEKKTVKKEPTKETKVVEEKPVEPVDPWKEDEQQESLLKETGTWKALSGLLVILLLFSIFSNGFNFASSGSSDGTVLALSEAEARAVSYVNNNLLQPPFEAQVEESADEGNLYRVTLSVAGEMVDSYITKDGSLFFPQGFPVNEDLAQETTLEPVEEPVVEMPEEPVQPVEEEPVEEVVLEDPVVQEPVVSKTAATVTVSAKKWLFEPQELQVKAGETVSLTVVPQNLAFTFAIPGLGVEQEITGETVVEFTADQTGEFDFVCASCEDWRGMKGTLVVE